MAGDSFDAATQAPELEKWIHSRVEEGVRKGILSSAIRLVGVLRDEVVPAESPPPIDTRAYVADWRHEVVEEGKRIDLVNSTSHGAVIEYGARAENVKVGRAMIDALAAWAYRKGLVGSPRSTGRARADLLDDARRVAWAIASSLQKRGIFNRDGQGLRIAQKTADRAPPIVAEEVEREISAAMKR